MNPGNKRPWSKAEDDRIQTARSYGNPVSWQKLADEFGVGRQSVIQRARDAGLIPGPSPRRQVLRLSVAKPVPEIDPNARGYWWDALPAMHPISWGAIERRPEWWTE